MRRAYNRSIPMRMLSDYKSLFDIIVKESCTSEKRLAIDLMEVREYYRLEGAMDHKVEQWVIRENLQQTPSTQNNLSSASPSPQETCDRECSTVEYAFWSDEDEERLAFENEKQLYHGYSD